MKQTVYALLTVPLLLMGASANGMNAPISLQPLKEYKDPVVFYDDSIPVRKIGKGRYQGLLYRDLDSNGRFDLGQDETVADYLRRLQRTIDEARRSIKSKMQQLERMIEEDEK